MKISSFRLGSAREYREQARARLKGGLATEVEVTALALCERAILSAPPESIEGPARSGLYAGTLATLAGVGGLSQGVVAVLEEFRCWQEPSVLRTLGDCRDQLVAARAVGPTQALATGFESYSIPLHGALDPSEEFNVREALRESVRKTGGKVLHLVKEIYLRPFLAETAQGELVDGLASGRRQVGLLNLTARDLAATRKALFHELGHELDRILSGGITCFRSDQEDNPFGRGSSISDYGGTSAAEDFAETHAALIEDWDRIRECPELFVHSRGEIGHKLAWIWEKGYRQELTPSRLEWTPERRRAAEGLRLHWPQAVGPDEEALIRELGLKEHG